VGRFANNGRVRGSGGAEWQAVIFDYGNVLSLSQAPSDVALMSNHLNVPVDLFEKQYWATRLAYDRGDFTGTTYWTDIAEKLERKITDSEIKSLSEIDNLSWSRPNMPIVAWAYSLRGCGLKTAILSNMPREFQMSMATNCRWLPEFDHGSFSWQLRAIKPDAAIYQHCLDGLNVAPENALFIDDRYPNIEGAQRMGLKTMLFTNTEQVCAELARLFDIPVLMPAI
jgi:putative hydrolase of the HAD superfamily